MDYPLKTHTARTRGDGMENESGTINNKSIPIESSSSSLSSTQEKLKFTLKNLLSINNQPQEQSTFNSNNNNNNNTTPTNLQSIETTTTTTTTNTTPIVINSNTENCRTIPGQNSIYRGFNTTNQSLPPVLPKGKIFHLIPKLVKTINNNKDGSASSGSSGSLSRIMKNKEPKFVPFEPYKGAVNPMIPYQNRKLPHKIKLNKRNNLDLNVLVKQMSNMKTFEMNQNSMDSLSGAAAGSSITSSSILSQLNSNTKAHDDDGMDKKLQELKIERDYFESQLKFQVQVNTELKNLLVAAVGEDLQTKVNVLTEDKLQLARALLNSAENLSSHTEQIEYLAGQSEVWRSKFLASSLMVEELARWKASLMQKNQILLSAQKQMLENMTKIRDMDIEMLRNLKFLAQLKSLRLPSANVLDLTAECSEIVQQLILHSGNAGIPGMIDLDLANLDTTTDAEKLAVEALQNSNQPLMETDEAFRAIVGQAFSSLRISSLPAVASLSPNDEIEKK